MGADGMAETAAGLASGWIVEVKTQGTERLDALFTRHHEALWRLALRMAGDADRAKDLVQETFLRAMTRRLPDDLRSTEAWLVRTLINLSRDLHRRRGVRRRHADGERRDAAAAPAEAGDGGHEDRVLARLTVERGLRRLSARRRAILALHDLEGLEPRRIGALLGIRPATVRWHLAAARRELGRWLTGREERTR